MLGMAPSADLPKHAPAASVEEPPHAPPVTIGTASSHLPSVSSAAVPETRSMPSRHQTQLGIAHPGIAPLRLDPPTVPAGGIPVAAVQLPAPPVAPAVKTGPLLASPQISKTPSQAPTLVSAESDLQEKARTRSLRVAAITVVSLAAVLAIAIVVLALAIRARGPVQAEVGLDGQGSEVLTLTCGGCDDGTAVTLGAEEATFRSHSAEIPLRGKLQVGDNELTLTLRYPDGRSEDVDLTVPVDYRLSTSLEGLAGTPPSVQVRIAANRETAVVVDGHPVALDDDGHGVTEVDVSQSLTGPATAVTRLDRTIPYTITPPNEEPEHGELTVRIGVVPLVVDAPGDSITIDTANFWLAGRTLKGGTITVGGRPITVDPEGRFAQLMNVSSAGETTIFIRAEAKDHAPRLVPLRVRRVTDLRAEAKRMSAQATRSYATLAEGLSAKQDWQVMLEGKIAELRTSNHTTVLLLDVKQGCAKAPCLIRARLGAKLAATSGDTATIVGRVSGAVDFEGRQIPEVRAEFVLTGPAP